MSKKSKKAAAEAAGQIAAAEAAADPKALKKAAKADKKAAKQLKKATKEAKKAAKAQKGGKGEAKKSKVFGCPIRNLIVTMVMSLLLGAAFLLEPTMVYTYCGYGIGGLVALVGLVYIIIYFLRKPVSGMYRSEFAIGLVALLAGAYVAVGGLITDSAGTSLTFASIVRILGVLMAADGIMKLQYTLDVARMRYSKWWVGLIFSVLGIALGVVTVMGITYELGDTMGIGGMMMLGIAFCVNGLLDIGAMIVVAMRNHKAEKAAVLAEAEAILAAAKKEKDPDFFTGADISAAGISAPAGEEASEKEPAASEKPAEPFFAPEPEIELAEKQSEPPAEPDPVLPDPVLATPTDEAP